MKNVLLLIIAVGVAYLAYSEYSKRRLVEQAIEYASDPVVYRAKIAAETAQLECDKIFDVMTAENADGSVRPARFRCKSGLETFLIEERICPDGNYDERASGAPKLGSVYMPLHVLCWDVKPNT
jgi:hypothetical protein